MNTLLFLILLLWSQPNHAEDGILVLPPDIPIGSCVALKEDPDFAICRGGDWYRLVPWTDLRPPSVTPRTRIAF